MIILESDYQSSVDSWEVNYRKDYKLISNRFYNFGEANRFYNKLKHHKDNGNTYYGELIREIVFIFKSKNT